MLPLAVFVWSYWWITKKNARYVMQRYGHVCMSRMCPYQDSLSVPWIGEVLDLDNRVKMIVTERAVVHRVGVIHCLPYLNSILQPCHRRYTELAG